MEEYLLHQNKRHFSQAEGTPFTLEPFRDIVGPSGTTPTATNILQGKLPNLPGTKGGAWQLLQQISQGVLPPISSINE